MPGRRGKTYVGEGTAGKYLTKLRWICFRFVIANLFQLEYKCKNLNRLPGNRFTLYE